jgi:hypothetical protein
MNRDFTNVLEIRKRCCYWSYLGISSNQTVITFLQNRVHIKADVRLIPSVPHKDNTSYVQNGDNKLVSTGHDCSTKAFTSFDFSPGRTYPSSCLVDDLRDYL